MDTDHSSSTTTDHNEIRRWAEARGGRPAQVREAPGLIRIDFGQPEDELEEIGWDAFFEYFEDNQLAFLHQEQTAEGATSRFNKFVARS